MRYFIVMGLSLLVWGCEEDPSIHNLKERTTDLIAMGVVEADDGEVWVLCQEVSRWKEGADPIHLDSEPIPDFPYEFSARTDKLRQNGQWYQSIGEENLSLVYSLEKIADGYLAAGIYFGTCGNYESRALPSISARDEEYRNVRWAQLPCEYGYALVWEWEVMRIFPLHIARLANGNLLYYGFLHDGLARLTCVTEYGEILWTQERSENIDYTSLTSLRNGGYAITDQGNEVVQLYDNNGVHGRDLEFDSTDEYKPQNIMQLENSSYVVAGIDRTTYDPHLWTFDPSGMEIGDTTLAIENCQDSVAVFGVNDRILLVCRNGTECSGPGSQTVVLLDNSFSVIGQESFGGNSRVVLKDVTVTHDGSILLCGAYDRGIGSYSAVTTKYSSDLLVEWRTVRHPLSN